MSKLTEIEMHLEWTILTFGGTPPDPWRPVLPGLQTSNQLWNHVPHLGCLAGLYSVLP